MKRVLVLALMLGAVSAAVLTAQTRPAAGDDAVMQADHALVNALEKGNSAAVNKLLDAEFTWIDTDGIMWARPDALRAGLKPLVPDRRRRQDHRAQVPGKVVWIQNNQGNRYAAHIWVQRPSGWRLLHAERNRHAPAPIGDERRAGPTYAVPCINPCKEVPYKPISASEKAALEQLAGPGRGNGRTTTCTSATTVTIGSNTMKPRKSATAPGPTPVNPASPVAPLGAAPVLWARTWDFGERGRRDHAAADLGRQGLLVQPHLRAITTVSGRWKRAITRRFRRRRG